MKNLLFVPACALAYLVFAYCTGNNAFKKDAPIFSISEIKVNKSPGSIEVADVNGDGIPDLLIANINDSCVTVLLGAGKGNFIESKGSPFAAGYMPNDIAVADINLDGKPDITIANHDRKYLTVLAGDGKGGFIPLRGSPFPVKVVPHTHGVIAADFNGDKRPDLVTDSWGNNRLEILFANRNSGFDTEGKYINVGKHPYQRLRTADIDKNGTMDIVTTNLDGNNATILLGDGKGNFHEAQGSPFACGDAPFGVAIGDLNHDGLPDLAIINSPTITASNTGVDGLTILLGNGKGRFKMMNGSPFKTGKSPSRVAIGDINGDGYADIAVANYKDNTINVFLMNKKGVYSNTNLQVGIKPHDGIAIADLYNKKRGNIVVSCGDNKIRIISLKQQ